MLSPCRRSRSCWVARSIAKCPRPNCSNPCRASITEVWRNEKGRSEGFAFFFARRERGDSRRRGTNHPEAHTGLTPGRQGEAATTPLQEAERNRCAGGRAAWMPREAFGAMDGPSRRAPGARMEGG
ncbi:hypothetical protein E8F20_23420 [Pseudomonas sp. BN415]|nr:hypothetical protein [Pseudomonas sp. BN415]